MWFANFFIAASMTMVLPFISLYIETFGNFSPSYVQRWSGWIFGITFVTAFIFSPIWGRIGDKYGRKNILIFSATGLAASVLLMGFATSVEQLFFLRLFMGIFTGFIPMSQALIATQTPKAIAGKTLGTLQTGNITGTLLGPLIGGVIADIFGYSATFKLISITIFLSALIVLFGIKEIQMKVTVKGEKSSYTTREVITHILSHPALLIVMLLSTVVQIAHFSIQPILSLYVAEINGVHNIAFYAGLVFSVAGLGNLLFARRWGVLGDKHGYMPVMIGLLIIASVVYLPFAFVNSIWQLVILRLILGTAIGGIVTTRIAYIRQEAPLAMQGEVLGYNTSLRFLGNVLGPALGGIVAGTFGFSAVFYTTSGLLLIAAIVTIFTHIKYELDGQYSIRKGA
ncbi:MAG TPA: MFS transporter [Pseudogracilibacillus sp.]|nr:MFS transporter [Pseudogracilibacillus sp.]